MREREFTDWLKAQSYKSSTWRTYLSDARKVERYKGDLDILYAMDKFQALFASFSCSEKKGILPTTDIPHKANKPYVTAASWFQCINHYKKFIESSPDYTQSSPDEVSSDGVFWEGAVRRVLVNLYERDREARTECIEHYGAVCSVCEVDFESVYGHIGKGIIHVHHLNQISEIKESYQIDPIADLRPVCPNCHVVIHRRSPPFSIDEMKNMIKLNMR